MSDFDFQFHQHAAYARSDPEGMARAYLVAVESFNRLQFQHNQLSLQLERERLYSRRWYRIAVWQAGIAWGLVILVGLLVTLYFM